MKIALVLHVFYAETFREIAKRIISTSADIDIFVTTCHSDLFPNNDIGIVKGVLLVPASYMDSVAFVAATSTFGLSSYDLVIKLHTKNSRTENSRKMMELYLDHLLSDRLLRDLSKEWKHAEFGLIGPMVYARSVKKLIYGNRAYLEKLAELVGIHASLEGLTFFAGTMFIIRGELLKPLELSAEIILGLVELERKNKGTGEDGSIAHALERFFSVLVKAQGYEQGFILFPALLESGRFEVKNSKHFPYDFYQYFFESGSNDARLRTELIFSNNDLDISSVLDLPSYLSLLHSHGLKGIKPGPHYIFFGDYLKWEQSLEKNFSSSLYRVERPDVFRATVPSILHFLERGKRERPGVFNRFWYQRICEKYFPSITFDFSYDNGGVLDFLKSKATVNCIEQPASLENRPSVDIRLRTFSTGTLVNEVLPSLLRARDLVKLQLEHDDFIGAGETAREASTRFLSLDMLEVWAVSVTLSQNWFLATRLWQRYQACKPYASRGLNAGLNRLIEYDREHGVSDVFRSNMGDFLIEQEPMRSACELRVCIYTSVFGDYDDLPRIEAEAVVTDNVDWIAFTDRYHLNADTRWKQILRKPTESTPNLSAKKYKVLPHRFLKNYDASLFVDGNTVFCGDINVLLAMLSKKGPFVMWRHPFRKDIFLECCAILASKRASPERIISQLRGYAEMGLGRDTGLCEGSFIWRLHHNERVVDFMEEWWQHIFKFSHRDQLSLGFLFFARNEYPAIIEDSWGTSRHNVFFFKTPQHKAGQQTSALFG